MFMNFSAFMENEIPSPTVFGMTMSRLDVADAARRIVAATPGTRSGPRVFIASDLGRIAMMRRDPELRAAMQSADLVTCGDLAAMRYARLRGCAVPEQVTARDLAAELMHRAEMPSDHALFFLVKDEPTAVAVRQWGKARGLRVQVEVASDLNQDPGRAVALAGRVAAFGATILFLGVDSPQAELFVSRHGGILPRGCWSLCVADGVTTALGVDPAPASRGAAFPIRRALRSLAQSARRIGRHGVDTLTFALLAYRELNASAPPRPGRREPSRPR